MRYIIFIFPFNMALPIATDFRLIAYIIAYLKSFFYKEVYIFDNDAKELIFSKGPLSPQELQDKTRSFPPLVTPKETPQAHNF